MGIEEFDDLLHQTILVEPFAGNDKFGEATFGAAVGYTGRAVGKTRIVRDAQGVERVSSYTVYMNATTIFSPKDRITLPAGYSPQQPLILSTGIFPDEDGLHHTVIYTA